MTRLSKVLDEICAGIPALSAGQEELEYPNHPLTAYFIFSTFSRQAFLVR
jgi:hypothetical protein